MTLINALIGLLTFVVLALFNIPFAPMWGLLMFLFGLAPAVLALLVRRRLREPERWKQAVAGGQVRKAGSSAAKSRPSAGATPSVRK